MQRVMPVAVKTLKDSPRISDIEDFLQEGAIMQQLNHPNLLNLLGISFGSCGQPSIILPYMALGDLRSFIADTYRRISMTDLLGFAVQIADGMNYLHSAKFVHRDLAARNCMLSENYVVKVGDFGLAVDMLGRLQRDSHSAVNRESELETTPKLPLKWMSPEYLWDRRAFSTKSDVWSFGVVLWELMTRGARPYEDVDNSEIRLFLESGRRLPHPFNCPATVFAIMMSCWRTHPHERPDFTNLGIKLRSIMQVV